MHAGGRRFDPAWLHQSGNRLQPTGNSKHCSLLVATCNASKLLLAQGSLTIQKLKSRKTILQLSCKLIVFNVFMNTIRVIALHYVSDISLKSIQLKGLNVCYGGRLRLYGQVIKRIRWMPWQREAMKDVVACEKPRGVGKLALIRGCPNGETHSACGVSCVEYIGA